MEFAGPTVVARSTAIGTAPFLNNAQDGQQILAQLAAGRLGLGHLGHPDNEGLGRVNEITQVLVYFIENLQGPGLVTGRDLVL